MLFDELGEHLSTTIPLMTTFPQLISLLATRPSPQMTIYSQERVELNGPVIARWFAKVANLLGSDLAPNLFDDPFGFETPSAVPSNSNDETRQALCLAVGPWQKLVWSVPALAMGLNLCSDPATLGVSDILVTDSVDEASRDALKRGAWVLAQPSNYLAFSWNEEPLPDGVLDALSEVGAQSDALEVPIPQLAPASVEEACGITHLLPADTASSESQRIALYQLDHCAPIAVTHWLSGRSLVLIDPKLYSEQEAQRIAESEGASLLHDGAH